MNKVETRDDREKLALGRLVTKAGLRHADRAFLLGVLTEAAQIKPGSAEYCRITERGNLAFRDARVAMRMRMRMRSSAGSGKNQPGRTEQTVSQVSDENRQPDMTPQPTTTQTEREDDDA